MIGPVRRHFAGIAAIRELPRLLNRVKYILYTLNPVGRLRSAVTEAPPK